MTKRTQFNILIYITMSVSVIALVSQIHAFTLLQEISYATAYVALVLVVTSLVLGPLWVLQGKKPAVSKYIRRDVGISSAVFTLLHILVGLFVHYDGLFWMYFIDTSRLLIIRHDLFGITNYLGLFSGMIIVLLLVTSNNFYLKKWGVKKWKKIQQFNYLSIILIAFHGGIYQFIQSREVIGVTFFSVSLILIAVVQYLGYKKVKSNNKLK